RLINLTRSPPGRTVSSRILAYGPETERLAKDRSTLASRELHKDLDLILSALAYVSDLGRAACRRSTTLLQWVISFGPLIMAHLFIITKSDGTANHCHEKKKMALSCKDIDTLLLHSNNCLSIDCSQIRFTKARPYTTD
uniref:Uncharacterized protein n=1 Tax=Aegilops tauschii subsp. strangulata TaxID=200361 RepID=A0A453CJ35_AEGTS